MRSKQADATGLTSRGYFAASQGVTQHHHVTHSSSGLKETPKTTKGSLERTHQLAGGGGNHPGLSLSQAE